MSVPTLNGLRIIWFYVSTKAEIIADGIIKYKYNYVDNANIFSENNLNFPKSNFNNFTLYEIFKFYVTYLLLLVHWYFKILNIASIHPWLCVHKHLPCSLTQIFSPLPIWQNEYKVLLFGSEFYIFPIFFFFSHLAVFSLNMWYNHCVLLYIWL